MNRPESVRILDECVHLGLVHFNGRYPYASRVSTRPGVRIGLSTESRRLLAPAHCPANRLRLSKSRPNDQFAKTPPLQIRMIPPFFKLSHSSSPSFGRDLDIDRLENRCRPKPECLTHHPAKNAPSRDFWHT